MPDTWLIDGRRGEEGRRHSRATGAKERKGLASICKDGNRTLLDTPLEWPLSQGTELKRTVLPLSRDPEGNLTAKLQSTRTSSFVNVLPQPSFRSV